MSIVAYSRCSIEFIPNENSGRKQHYSDRSMVEIRQHEFDDYSLRGIDIEKNKAKIFDIQLTKRNIYKIRSSPNVPDEVRCKNGTYYLLLNPEARDQFHTALNTCFEQLGSMAQGSIDAGSEKSSANKSTTDSLKPRTIADGNEILINIHKLSEYIENGDVKNAVNLARILASQHVQVKGKILERKLDDEQLHIRVKIDGVDLAINDKDKEYVLNVYRSTVIHELRAMFQYTHDFPLADQYFFVNGHMAYVESTMNDLNVQNNALFVLFVTKNKREQDNVF